MAQAQADDLLDAVFGGDQEHKEQVLASAAQNVRPLPPVPTAAPKPRPLTNKEKKRLREKNGGFASDSQLASLASKFTSHHGNRDEEVIVSHNTNGWSK